MELGKIIWEQPHLMSKILYEFRGLTTPSAIAFKTDCIISNTLYNERQITEYIFQAEGFTHFQCIISFNKKRFRFVNMKLDEDEVQYYDVLDDNKIVSRIYEEYNENKLMEEYEKEFYNLSDPNDYT